MKDNFYWGNPSSSMQTEGAWDEGGKGKSRTLKFLCFETKSLTNLRLLSVDSSLQTITSQVNCCFARNL